jgi:hypothetical protein
MAQRISCWTRADDLKVSSFFRGVRLEIRAQCVWLQHSGKHADLLTDRLGQVQNPQIRWPSERAKSAWIFCPDGIFEG